MPQTKPMRQQAIKSAVDHEAHEPLKQAPSSEIKRLRRQISKQMHPDFAINEADRIRRTRFMAEVNIALDRGDQQAIEAILIKFANGAPSCTAEPESELGQILEKLEKLSVKLKAINYEIGNLENSDIAKLMHSIHRITVEDLLARLAACAADNLRAAKERHEQIKQQVGHYVA